MDIEVHDNQAENRYEVWADGELAGFTRYVLRPGRIAFVHTEIHEPYEGLGLGSRLAREALDDTRARGLMVEPFCPFIAGFIERHLDEYRDLVDPGMLSRENMSEKPPADGEEEREESAISTRGRTPPRT